ncbi:geranylgeranylglyceryl/heptaprenylglyceryl phosphate synthase [candidate division KSB1 bacterium]|nr:geranylgeranylglyceryl/heptaprenylglyceryl phosphate synthase [candidate division KSB1 bacterium]RQW05143.1 MAG: geranylgeranylglyceryl/heptaprenylglyceryl phosphate synthase [candidate division KSB1 bacterium]
MKVYNQLLAIKEKKGAGYLVLIDPDKQDVDHAIRLAQTCEAAGVDALLVGGSLLLANVFDETVKGIKKNCSLPVIIFPGSTKQISRHADAILFLSLISGRNPESLIGGQVVAAPIIKSIQLEPISTGYMFIESGTVTSALFMSDTRPIPREKPDIAAAHALAAQYIGMQCVYLEGGSGAKYSVPDDVVGAVASYVDLPIICGGGIRTPDEAREKVLSGASFIVTGTIIERDSNPALIKAFADAIHVKE